MGITSNEAKQRWNTTHYTQVKVSVSSELAAAFKAKCVADGVSIASELSRFMSEETSGHHAAKTSINPYKTRPQRRKALNTMIDQLGALMAAEQSYLDNIPENLQNSRFYNAAEHSISVFDEALNILTEAY
jgi:hypothetical protein